MSKYEEMSNFEINRKLAELLHNPSEPYCIIHDGVWHKSVGHIIGSIPHGAFKFLNDDRWWVPFPDYCNNPSDIIPIAIESKLKIEWLDDDEGDYCNVQSPCGSVFSDDENPYRAMSICFLKMKDAEVK